MFGITCGTLITKLNPLLCLLVVSCSISCKNVQREDEQYIVYKAYSFEKKEVLNVDTVYVHVLDSENLKLKPKGKQSFYIRSLQSGIYRCDSAFTNCTMTHSFQDTSRLDDIGTNRESALPFFRDDTRLVGFKEYRIEDATYKVFKFKEDELRHSHSVKYSYFVKDLGFVAFINYFEETYSVMEDTTTDLNSQRRVNLSSLIDSIVGDTAFFEYPTYLDAPPVFQAYKKSARP